MNNFVDYYDFLGIKMSASSEEIKVACQKILRENDLLAFSRDSEEFQNRQFMRSMTFEIYRVLSDVKQRRMYDEKLIEYKKLEKKNSYFNAYREDKKNATIDTVDDFSATWQSIIHSRNNSVDRDVNSQDQTTTRTNVTTEVIRKKTEENSSTTVSTDNGDKTVEAMVTKKETNSSSSQLKGKKPVKSTTSPAKKPTAPVKRTTGSAKKPTTPVKSTTSSAKKSTVPVKSNQTSSVVRSTSNKTVVDEKAHQKPGRYLAVKTEPTKMDSCKKYFSNQVLSVSKAFVRGILNLEIRKGDTFKKYVLRNKTAVVGTMIVGAIGVAAFINSHKEVPVEENIIFTESVDSTDETVENLDYTIPETRATLPKEDVITLYRVHKIVPGDTLSKLSADSNTTFEEIKHVNNMSSDNVVLGKKYFIPYIIDANDLYIYTMTASYDPNMSLDEFASKYETNDATMSKLNPDAIVYVAGSGYRILTDSLVVPNFVTKDEYREIKAAERITQNLKK